MRPGASPLGRGSHPPVRGVQRLHRPPAHQRHPRRALHAPENALGDRLAVIVELSDDELGVLGSVIDDLVAKSRLLSLAGGVS